MCEMLKIYVSNKNNDLSKYGLTFINTVLFITSNRLSIQIIYKNLEFRLLNS